MQNQQLLDRIFTCTRAETITAPLKPALCDASTAFSFMYEAFSSTIVPPPHGATSLICGEMGSFAVGRRSSSCGKRMGHQKRPVWPWQCRKVDKKDGLRNYLSQHMWDRSDRGNYVRAKGQLSTTIGWSPCSPLPSTATDLVDWKCGETLLQNIFDGFGLFSFSLWCTNWAFLTPK